MRDIGALLREFVRLWAVSWPSLVLISACGAIAGDLLLPVAVAAGFRSPLAGFAILSLLVLVKLIVVVLMLLALRQRMPAVTAMAAGGSGVSAAPVFSRPRGDMLGPVGLVLIPFFAYYAAWGFLGDTVREYSLLALTSAPLGEKSAVLDVPNSVWLLIAVLGSWALRRAARRIRERGGRSVWQFVVVACDANWLFIGLYVLSRWKDQFWTWIGTGGPLPYLIWLRDGMLSLIAAARAATATPVELAETPLRDVLQGLFFYALLPLVWLLMVAVVYGYDVAATKRPALHPRAERILQRFRNWPGFVRDFVEHFVAGYRSRYMPVVASARLAFGAGLPTLLALIVLYRSIGWLGAWGWVGLTRLIGPQDLATWQALASPIGLLLGGPSDIRGGILIESLRLCLLAAVMERAVSLGHPSEEPVTDSGGSADSRDVRTPD